MSRLNRIQNEIKQLEGGKFQNLCDEYLYRKMNWDNIVSLGSMAGTDKTTIGTPDTYTFSDWVERYTFVMSGTRKDSTAKLESDIKDAIAKTLIDEKNIQEIICCHTSSNLTVNKAEKLKELAKPAKLSLIGIDTIAQDLLQFRYQDIVRDFLGIAETTEQVWLVDQFIAIHDKSKTNAPLNVTYVDDRNVIHTLIDALSDNQILLLYGACGTGKTKLAIEICKILSINSNVICVKNNGMPVYQDIKDSLDNNKVNYLFLDDANTITNYSAIINLLKLKGYEQNLKIILTVREYALSEIMDVVQAFETRVEQVSLMDDFKIEMLIKNVLSDADANTVNRIMKQSNNNPRIAVLAAMMDRSKIDFPENKGILDTYYRQILRENSVSNNEKLALFILSFITKIDLSDQGFLNELLPFFGMEPAAFIEATNQLHDKKICDIFQSRFVQVSDQSLSDFVLSEFISNSKVFKIRDFFIKLYPSYAKEITEMLINIDNYSFSKEWSEYLDNEIKFVNFAAIKEEYREDFLICFGAFVPTEAFAYVLKKIQETKTVKYKVTQKDFQSECNGRITDPIIQILSLLAKNERFNNAGKLLVEYLKKRQDKVFEVFVAIKSSFDVEYDWNDYLAKRINIFETFSNQKNIDELTALLIVNIAENFLKFSEEKTLSNVVIVSPDYHLSIDVESLNHLHKNIFETLFKIYCKDSKEVNIVIDRLLINYPDYEIDNWFVDTIISDLKCISNLFFKDVTTLTVRKENILYKLHTQVNKYGLKILPFSDYQLTNRQKIFNFFSTDEYRFEMEKLNYDDSKKFRVEKLNKIFTEYAKNLEELFNILSEYQSDELLINPDLEESIFQYYSAVETDDKVRILTGLLNSNFLVSYSPSDYMNQLSFEEGENVLSLIHKEVSPGWYISNMLTCEFIDQEQVDEMTLILKKLKENVVFDSFDILAFESYINQESNFLELFWDYFNEEKINCRFFIPDCENEQMLERIKKIIGVEKMEKIYLDSMGIDYIDYSGKLFKSLLKEKNIDFAYSFLLKLHSIEIDYGIQEYYSHIHYLWEFKNIETVIGLYIDYLIKESLLTKYGLDHTLQLLLKANFEGSMDFIIDEIFKTNDECRLVNLYNLILEIYDEEILFVFFQLLKEKKISDDSFREINLARHIGDYSGSFTSILEKHIIFLNSLLLIFDDIEYLSYSCIITEYIEYLKLYNESERLSDYLK